MKKILILSLTAMVLMISCRKSDNPKLVGVEKVPLPQLAIDVTADQVIKGDAADAFSGRFTVGLYFPDLKPAKMDIVIIKNGITTNVQTLKAGVTTFPTTVTVTGLQLKALFGNVSTVTGDSYTIGADITTTDGKFYPAFSSTANQTNSNVAALIGSSPTITYGALCGFHMSDFGNPGDNVPAKVLKDGWVDYQVGDAINLHIIDATHMSFVYATSNNTTPIVITIDPATNKTSVAKIDFGNYGDGLEFFTSSVAGSADNQVLPCALTVSMRLNFSDAKGGTYAAQTLIIQKK